MMTAALLMGLAFTHGTIQTRADPALPSLRIEENCGQADPRFPFLARDRGLLVGLGSAEITVHGSAARRTDTFELRLIGARSDAPAAGVSGLPGRVSYFVGRDPQLWVHGAATWRRVRYDDVWPGIDVEYHIDGGRLEMDFVVATGADVRDIRLESAGGDPIFVQADGSARILGAHGELSQEIPHVWRVSGGERVDIRGGFVPLTPTSVGFEVDAARSDGVLVIDPTLEYCSYLGGEASDVPLAVAVDSQGGIVVAGHTASIGFPVERPLDGTVAGFDAFVTRLTPDGTQAVFSTYLGGSASDAETYGLAIDAQGAIYLSGVTSSSDFPTTAGVVQPLPGGMVDLYAAKLSADGSVLEWATYLGGARNEYGFGTLAVDSMGQVVVTGSTESFDYPLQNPVQSLPEGGTYGGIVTALSADGTALRYSTFLGLKTIGAAVDALDRVLVVGATASDTFPTVNALQPTRAGLVDNFVARFSASGALDLSTYLGGSEDEQGNKGRIAARCSGEIVVSGGTGSSDFPVVNPIPTPQGFGDWYVSVLSADGSSLVFSTILGGTLTDDARAMSVAPDGDIIVAGTFSPGFPRVDSPWPQTSGAGIARIREDFSGLEYSTVFRWMTQINAVATDCAGRDVFVGHTPTSDGGLPVVRPFQATKPGDVDAVIVRLESAAGSAPTARIDPLLGVKAPGPSLSWSWPDTVNADEYHLYAGLDRTQRPGTRVGTAPQGAPTVSLPWPPQPLVLYQVVGARCCAEGAW